VLSLAALEGSRFKVVGMDDLPTFRRVTTWFSVTIETFLGVF
jgi:hypothetical protein